MDNLLHHPARVALALLGILFALAAFTFFGQPVMLIPAVPLLFRFLCSRKRFLIVVGWGVALLVVVSFCTERTKVEGFPLEKLVVFGGPGLMILAFIHFMASKTSEGSSVPPQDQESANKAVNPTADRL